MPPNPLVNASLRSPRAMQILLPFQNILNPPPQEIKSCERPLFFHPTSTFLPHTHTSPTSLLSLHLSPPSSPSPHTQLPNFFLFFTPPLPPPHAPNFQPTQCNQEYCSIHIPLCPRVYDQVDMIRGGNSLDWPITIHL